MLLKPQIGVQLDHSHPLAHGLVGAWLMNEGGGIIAHDLSGHGNDGTLTNMDPATDWVPDDGGALDFDGSNDYLSLTNAFEPGSQDWWIAFWVSLDSYPAIGDEMALCGRVSDANSDGVFVNSNGDVFLRIGGTLGTKLDDSPIPLNEWTHVIVTREHTTNYVTVYFNGSKGLIFGINDTGNPWRNHLTTVFSWNITDGGVA